MTIYFADGTNQATAAGGDATAPFQWSGNTGNSYLCTSKSTSSSNRHIAFVIWNGSYETKGTIGGGNAQSVNYSNDSDYRVKENVATITNGIEKCKLLRPVTFNYISSRKATGQVFPITGFIAHELDEVGIPGTVEGEKDAMQEIYYQEGDTIPDGKKVGDFKEYSTTEISAQMVDISKLVPTLTSAVKDLITKVETLETKVAALEAG